MRLRLRILFLSGQHARKIFEIQGQIKMVCSECPFTKVQGPFKEGQGFFVLFLSVMQCREVTQTDGELRVAISKNLFIQSDDPTQQRFGLLIFALRVMDSSQFRQRLRKPGITFAELFGFVERGVVLFLSLLETSLLKEKVASVHVPVPGGFRVLASRQAEHDGQTRGNQPSPRDRSAFQHLLRYLRHVIECVLRVRAHVFDCNEGKNFCQPCLYPLHQGEGR